VKAVLCRKYGGPEALQLEEIETPTPGENQVLVKVHAASANAADYRTMRGRPILIRPLIGGLLRPKDPRLGVDLAGRVEAVGDKVERFRPGDEVFGWAKGAFAEFALTREPNLAPKPANSSFEEAAAVPVAALTALQGIRLAGGVQPGKRVLVQGASGGVGTFAVQLAKFFGAEVTAVCSPRNLDTARSIGADHVVDYTRVDFTRSGLQYDLVFAANGHHSLLAYRRALTPQGVYVCAGGSMAQFLEAMLLGRWMSRKGGRKLLSMGTAKVDRQDLEYLGQLLDAGSMFPLIDRVYPLSEVPAAIHYLEETHAQGKVVIRVVGAT
jgi:NADPH:quinone reductase-like Zn-dependent oxidoreductase